MNKISLMAVTVLLLGVSPVLAADTYAIDPAHSNIGFTVKHMMISNTAGNFDKVDGTVAYDPKDLANSKVNVTIDASSVNTRNSQRDEHLKSPDFFDTKQFPTITFVSKSVSATEIVGDLTMHGVTKEITLPVTISGPVPTMGGKSAIGISGSIVINRQDFGIKYNKALDNGGLALSNEVNVSFSVEADK